MRSPADRSADRRPRSCAVAALVFLAPVHAGAHGLEAHRVEVISHARTVEVVATPPVSLVAFADRDGDGLLSAQELSAQRPAVLRALSDALRVTLTDGTAPEEIAREDVSIPHAHDGRVGGAPYLRWTAVLRFAREAAPLSLRCGFARDHEVSLFATRADGRSEPGRLLFVGTPEGGVLRGPDAGATLFASASPPSRSPAPPAVARPPSNGRRRESEWYGGALVTGASVLAALAWNRSGSRSNTERSRDTEAR